MRHRLITFWPGVSLAAFVACCALWALSYGTDVGVGRRVWSLGGSGTVAVTEAALASARGRVVLGTRSRQFAGGTPGGPARRSVQWFRGRGWLYNDVRLRDWYGPGGFEFGFSSTGPGLGRDGWTLYVPYWFLLLLTAAMPGYRLSRARSLRRQARRQLNLCRRCGYDLRATPDRCPECGTEAGASGAP